MPVPEQRYWIEELEWLLRLGPRSCSIVRACVRSKVRGHLRKFNIIDLKLLFGFSLFEIPFVLIGINITIFHK